MKDGSKKFIDTDLRELGESRNLGHMMAHIVFIPRDFKHDKIAPTRGRYAG
jgi:hypothetical protein